MISDLVLTSVNDGVRLIKFNTPNRKNAWPLEIYTQLINILKEDAVNDTIVLTIVTGEGEYYSSGNDFLPQLQETDTYYDIITRGVEIVNIFVKALIDYPKLLVAVVNGPAIGFAVTTLALFDVVYASEYATFSTPFVTLGVCPEACSSYLFPQIMGRSKASEMFFFGQKLTAEEALKGGLVSEVVPHNQLNGLFERLHKYGRLPVNAIKNTKKLIISNIKDALYEASDRECRTLYDCFQSEEFLQGMMKFAGRPKSKL